MTTVGDDALLETLRAALAPSPLAPAPEELALLRRALGADVAVSPDGDTGIEVPVVSTIDAPRRGLLRMRNLRHPVAVAAAAAVLATGGVAAAAVATDTLPGPARQIAFSLGLPVTSPALETVRSDLDALSRAIAGRHPNAIATAARQLQVDLAALDAADRRQVASNADQLLDEASTFLAPGTIDGEGTGPGSSEPEGSGAGGVSGSSGSSDHGGGSVDGTSGPSGSGSDGVTSGSDGAPSGTAGPSSSDGGSTGTPDGGGSGATSGSDGGSSTTTTTTTTTLAPTSSDGSGPYVMTDGGGSSDGGSGALSTGSTSTAPTNS